MESVFVGIASAVVATQFQTKLFDLISVQLQLGQYYCKASDSDIDMDIDIDIDIEIDRDIDIYKGSKAVIHSYGYGYR